MKLLNEVTLTIFLNQSANSCEGDDDETSYDRRRSRGRLEVLDDFSENTGFLDFGRVAVEILRP